MKNKPSKPIKYEIVPILVLIIIIICLRALNLDADPPLGLSNSFDVYTDPSNLTLYAKHKALFDDFTPFGDDRFVLFLKSSITVLSYLIFKIFGTSLISSNLVGLLFSIGSLLLFFLIVRKTGGVTAGIIYLIIIGLNYNQLFYGRLPFQEHAMAFWGFLAMVLILYSNKKTITLAAGIILGVSIFFGKIIGVAFFIPFLAFFIYQITILKTPDGKKQLLLFSTGLSLMLLFWLFYVYMPMKNEVGGYIGEHVYALYGFPEGLTSPTKFILSFMNFGNPSNLISRMLIPALFGSSFMVIVLYSLIKYRNNKEIQNRLNAGQILITFLIIGFYLFLMCWNYRPLRYQLILIYPIMAGAALVLSKLWEEWKKPPYRKISLKLFFILVPFCAVIAFHLFSLFVKSQSSHFTFDENMLIIYLSALLLAAVIYFLVRVITIGKIPINRHFTKAVVIISMLVTILYGVKDYYNWAVRPTFTTRDNSLDLGKVLSSDAVISGPYSSVLTIENKFKSIIHMFGVSEVDPNFFLKYPITHIVLDKANEERARKDYPDIMGHAIYILSYHIGTKIVSLYKISGFTGNSQAELYQNSLFEQIVQAYNNRDKRLSILLGEEYINKYPDNISGNTFLALAAKRDGFIDLAERFYLKATDFSPTNFYLTGKLAGFYHDRYNQTDSIIYKEKAGEFYQKTIHLFPYDENMKNSYQQLVSSP